MVDHTACNDCIGGIGCELYATGQLGMSPAGDLRLCDLPSPEQTDMANERHRTDFELLAAELDAAVQRAREASLVADAARAEIATLIAKVETLQLEINERKTPPPKLPDVQP